MKKVTIFDQPLCSAKISSGQANSINVCAVKELVKELKDNSVDVELYFANHNLPEFYKNEEVRNVITTRGMDMLPIIVVDDKIVLEGMYPTKEQLEEAAGVHKFMKLPLEFVKDECGCGGNCDGSCH